MILLLYVLLIYPVCVYSSETSNELTICPSFKDYNGLFINRQNPKCHTEPLGSPEEWIKEVNCTLETYEITTTDGYILTLYRSYCDQITGKYPILLGHGLCSNSSLFIIGKEKSPGVAIIKAGYEAWLLNFRGTSSSKHLTLDKNNTEFWDFSFHQVGVLDYPAAIDFIRNFDKKKYGAARKVVIIGLSLGSIALSVFGSEVPDYAYDVSIHHIHISPAHSYLRTRELVRAVSPMWYAVEKLLMVIYKNGELKLSTPQSNSFWLKNRYTMRIDQLFFGLVFGFNLEAIDPEVYPFMVIQSKDSNSVKSVIHILQNFASLSFTKYNYGIIKNLIFYKALKPPEYTLSNINVNTTYFTSKYDKFADVQDTKDFYYNKLPKSVQAGLYIMEPEKFTHIDYIAYNKNSRSEFTFAHLLPVLESINNTLV